jgi:hypothetical protein
MSYPIFEDDIFDVNEPNETYRKSYEERFQDLVKWQIQPDTDFIREKDLLKILQLTKGEDARKGILERLQVDANLYGTEQTPLNRPMVWKAEYFKAICDQINSGKPLKREERATIKKEFIEKFTPKDKPAQKENNDGEIFKEIAQINIVHFLNKVLDYQPSKGKNGLDWIQKLDEKRSRGVEIQSKEGKKYLVVNAKDAPYDFIILSRDQSFKGGLLQFVMKEILGHNDTKSNENKKEAIDYIRQNYNLTTEKISYSFKEKSAKPKEEAIPVDKAFTKLEYPIYLMSRGISLKTLSSAQFKGLVGNSYDRNQAENRNITFKMSNLDGLETSLEKNKNEAERGYFQKGVSTSGMLFKSNEGKGGYDTMVFGESTIDLLSKIELDGGVKKNEYYVSTNGFINDGQLDHIKTIIEDKQLSKLVINIDKDKMGLMFANKILSSLLNDLSPEQIDDLHPELFEKIASNKDVVASLDPKDKEKATELMQDSNASYLTLIKKAQELGFIKLDIAVNQPKGKDFNQDLMETLGLTRENIIQSKEDATLHIDQIKQTIKTGSTELDIVQNAQKKSEEKGQSI